jgi:hypothetical protein
MFQGKNGGFFSARHGEQLGTLVPKIQRFTTMQWDLENFSWT